ncbi:MAG: dynamin family protein [Deltaproteobacteria bacterium]|nr:dynamin family protein [Deltaproteobacteria bacterium]
MTLQALKAAAASLAAIAGGLADSRFRSEAESIGFRLDHPSSWATFVGETSSGKSALINSFLGDRILPTGVKPTTATVVHLAFVPPEDTPDGDVFRKIVDDGRGAPLEEAVSGREEFAELCRFPSDGMKRLRLFTGRKGTGWAGFQIFDTPGYNSLMERHLEVFRAFVPNSDVLVLVTGYRTGFGLVEQELFETVSQASGELDAPPPLVLVINRAPQGAGFEEKRVKEIMSRAGDCLRRKFDAFIVPSARPVGGGFLPLDTQSLFDRIFELTLSPEAASKTEATIRDSILTAIDRAAQHLRTERAGLRLKMESVRALSKRIASLEEIRSGCIDRIEAFFGRLGVSCGKLVKAEIDATREAVERELDSSGRWFDAAECAVYLCAHTVPFGARRTVAAASDHLRSRMEALDGELRAYCIVASRHSSVSLPGDRAGDDPAEDVLVRLAGADGDRVSDGAMTSLFAGTAETAAAGLTGAAAGGNPLSGSDVAGLGGVALVSLIPGIALKHLNTGLMLATDAFFIIYEAKTWKSFLRKKIGKCLDLELDSDVKDGISGQLRSLLAELLTAKLDGVPRLLEEEIRILRRGLEDTSDPEERIGRTLALSAELDALRAGLDPDG